LKTSKVETTDYHVWDAMLEKCHELQPKHKTTDELKATQQTIWKRAATTCLSVMFVHPTQAIKIFGNVSTPFRTVAIS